jgi:hypothetical protein
MASIRERFKFYSDGSVGLGTISPGSTLNVGNEWWEIQKLADTNLAVKIALERLMTVYHLSKEHGNSKT